MQVDYDERPWRKIGWRRIAAQLELKLARRARRYAQAPQTLVRLLADAMSHGVDHVVLSGDLTALALDDEFEGVRRSLGDLADRADLLTVIPGNHDVFTPGSLKKKRFDRWFGHLLDSDLPGLRSEGPWPHVRLVGEGAAIVGLCSARVPPIPGIAAGDVGADQLEALVKICAHPKVRGRTIHVVVHHAPLRPDGKVDRRDHGLVDSLRLLQACKLGNVNTILCGHIHNRFLYAVDGGPTIVGGGSSTWLGHEGYWLIDGEGGELSGLHERKLEAAPAAANLVAPNVATQPSVGPAPEKATASPLIVPARPLAAAG